MEKESGMDGEKGRKDRSRKMIKQTISLRERGERRQGFEMMVHISDYFEDNMNYLIGTSDDSPSQRGDDRDGVFLVMDEIIQDLELIRYLSYARIQEISLQDRFWRSIG